MMPRLKSALARAAKAGLPLAVAIVLGISAAALAESPVPKPTSQLAGTWLTADGSTKISFEPCGPVLCGRIVWLIEPNDTATGRPATDVHNSNPALRSRTINGMMLLSGLEPSTPGAWTGQVYNPRDGGTYDVTLTLKDAAHLELEGCILAVLCQSEIWSRVAVAAPPAGTAAK